MDFPANQRGLIVLAVNLPGGWLRDTLKPKLRRPGERKLNEGMTDTLLIHDIRPWAASPADIVVQGGRITAIGADLAARSDAAVLEGRGRIARPGLVEAQTCDTWGPYGHGDMLDRAAIVGLRNNLRRDHAVELARRICTQGGAAAMWLAGDGLAPGCQAELVPIPAEKVASLVVDRSRDGTVRRRGRLVAAGFEPVVAAP